MIVHTLYNKHFLHEVQIKYNINTRVNKTETKLKISCVNIVPKDPTKQGTPRQHDAQTLSHDNSIRKDFF